MRKRRTRTGSSLITSELIATVEAKVFSSYSHLRMRCCDSSYSSFLSPLYSCSTQTISFCSSPENIATGAVKDIVAKIIFNPGIGKRVCRIYRQRQSSVVSIATRDLVKVTDNCGHLLLTSAESEPSGNERETLVKLLHNLKADFSLNSCSVDCILQSEDTSLSAKVNRFLPPFATRAQIEAPLDVVADANLIGPFPEFRGHYKCVQRLENTSHE
jgi:hypothetical protein